MTRPRCFLTSAEKTKRKWIATLKIGDVVCDCRCKHLAITEIGVEKYPPLLIRRVLSYFPDTMSERLESYVDRLGLTVLYDYQLQLEDGSRCSALSCCMPADDHEEGECNG